MHTLGYNPCMAEVNLSHMLVIRPGKRFQILCLALLCVDA